jgi:hypothetical protein
MYTKKGWKCCSEFDDQDAHPYDTVVMPEGYKHYAKAVCKHCSHFLYWLKNPSTVLQNSKNQEYIDYLESVNEYLNDYERTFIRDMKHRKKLSPKQTSYLKSVYERFSILKIVATKEGGAPIT